MGSWIKDLQPNEDENDFGRWAFGKNYQNLYGGSEFMNAWNERHAHDLFLRSSDSKPDSVAKMVDLWREQRDEND